MRDLTDAEVRQIKTEAANRCVVICPAQFLSPQEQIAVARRFGEVLVPGHTPSLDGAHGVMQIQNVLQYKGSHSGTNIWHTDATHMPAPPSLTLLSCAQPAPMGGGDTMWANQYLAYDTLSDTMKEMIRGRRLGFRIGPGYGQWRGDNDPEETFHPLVRVHAETGRKSIFITADIKTSRIEGLAPEESRLLKDYLYRHSQTPEHIYRHRWSKGDLAIWDNRCSLHYAILDYDVNATRTMNRVMITGEVPIGDSGSSSQH
jgi:taurine dioxygenase